MTGLLAQNREQIPELCRRHHVLRLEAFGSAAKGGFDPATSDIDFIAAVARPPSPAIFDELAAMHRQLRDSGRPLATELEGSYIHRAALRLHNPAARHDTANGGICEATSLFKRVVPARK